MMSSTVSREPTLPCLVGSPASRAHKPRGAHLLDLPPLPSPQAFWPFYLSFAVALGLMVAAKTYLLVGSLLGVQLLSGLLRQACSSEHHRC